ncbi:protein Aatf [Topomyia yanbarensis]|uniref:protein Aatf n=1 Tax=Topomyia yanbarensis TaxID=2498891 RepID=UPI00273B518B|nr:protein Aatf [Topomyia yanbarensis]
MQKTGLKKRPTVKTVSDKIHEQIAAKVAVNADDSEDEETRPRFSEFDENDEILQKAANRGLSDIRKKNIKLLDTVDRKYRGLVSCRDDVFTGEKDGGESELSDSEDDGQQPGAFVRLRPSNDDSYSDDGEEDDGSDSQEVDEFNDDEEDDEDNFSLGDFLGQSTADTQKLLQEENQQEVVQKGICVQNQLKMWERLLEIRIKMQPSLITANSLPHEDKYNGLCKDSKFKEAADKIVQTVESTLTNLLVLQETLAQRFSETKDLLKTGTKRKRNDESGTKSKSQRLSNFETTINANFTSYKPYRNDVIQKWYDRTKASSNIKNAQQSLNIIKKIENGMLAKDDLIRKSQLYRGGYELFEKSALQISKFHAESEDAPDPVYNEEIFDDSDFYHALLRELIEYKSNTVDNPQEISAKLAELQKLRSKMKKQVDTRASKGRKIRYVVHKKLVNFTAPESSHEWTEEAKNELFSSLFGGSNGTLKG